MTLKNVLTQSYFKEPLVLLRVWLGIAFIMHGTPGIFSPDYMLGHTAIMESFGLPFPELLAYLSKGGELISGILLILGLFTRPAAVVIIVNMLVATFFAMQGDIFGDFQGEISFTYLLVALVLFLAGPGLFALDHKLFGLKT